MRKKVEIAQLANGIRIVHLQTPLAAAYCGLTINTGTRDELDNEHGLAHFLEHLLFKGTKKRKGYHINNRLESVGGELNAFTGKEETVIHAAILSSDFAKALDLIADVSFNSIFPEAEIRKEREVIFDEINSYKDSPSELIFDDFEEYIFPNCSLGRNILGDKKSLKHFYSIDLHRFVSRNYSTEQMVISSVGKISFKRVVKLVERYFSSFSIQPKQQDRIPPPAYKPFCKTINKNTYQTHCVIGNRAYQLADERSAALTLLMNILGGPLSNSRLNTSLREKYGLAYNVEASYTPYQDTGLFNIYFGTSKAALDNSINAVMAELKKLRTDKLTTLQLHRAKKQMIGQLIIANESPEQLMLTMGKSLLSLNRIDTIEESLAKIHAVTPEMLFDIANELFDINQLSTLTYM
ncbi:MAG: insulinase family protein [Prevotellaceae bacterium]|jgi:predicted Zn-dependent peptidase|nr:insulinase family protein [Prevotellaceae bacterium]